MWLFRKLLGILLFLILLVCFSVYYLYTKDQSITSGIQMVGLGSICGCLVICLQYLVATSFGFVQKDNTLPRVSAWLVIWPVVLGVLVFSSVASNYYKHIQKVRDASPLGFEVRRDIMQGELNLIEKLETLRLGSMEARNAVRYTFAKGSHTKRKIGFDLNDFYSDFSLSENLDLKQGKWKLSGSSLQLSNKKTIEIGNNRKVLGLIEKIDVIILTDNDAVNGRYYESVNVRNGKVFRGIPFFADSLSKRHADVHFVHTADGANLEIFIWKKSHKHDFNLVNHEIIPFARYHNKESQCRIDNIHWDTNGFNFDLTYTETGQISTAKITIELTEQ